MKCRGEREGDALYRGKILSWLLINYVADSPLPSAPSLSLCCSFYSIHIFLKTVFPHTLYISIFSLLLALTSLLLSFCSLTFYYYQFFLLALLFLCQSYVIRPLQFFHFIINVFLLSFLLFPFHSPSWLSLSFFLSHPCVSFPHRLLYPLTSQPSSFLSSITLSFPLCFTLPPSLWLSLCEAMQRSLSSIKATRDPRRRDQETAATRDQAGTRGKGGGKRGREERMKEMVRSRNGMKGREKKLESSWQEGKENTTGEEERRE